MTRKELKSIIKETLNEASLPKGALDRMEGLVSISSKNALIKAANTLRNDLSGFDRSDINLYLKTI